VEIGASFDLKAGLLAVHDEHRGCTEAAMVLSSDVGCGAR
jgi:hypothetical protein